MIDLSFFSREVNVALCSCVRARWNSSERLRNVFRHLRILSDPTKNLATLKIKNVTPINVKKLAGLPFQCLIITNLDRYFWNSIDTKIRCSFFK